MRSLLHAWGTVALFAVRFMPFLGELGNSELDENNSEQVLGPDLSKWTQWTAGSELVDAAIGLPASSRPASNRLALEQSAARASDRMPITEGQMEHSLPSPSMHNRTVSVPDLPGASNPGSFQPLVVRPTHRSDRPANHMRRRATLHGMHRPKSFVLASTSRSRPAGAPGDAK